MDPTTGAYQHISIGIRELSKHFDLKTILPPRQSKTVQNVAPQHQEVSRWKASGWFGAARDVRDFLRLMVQALRIAKQVKESNCDGVYLRVQTLSPLPIILRVLQIKCFLEANGLQFQSRLDRFNSWFSQLYRPFEYLVYRTAAHVFFVGSYGDYWKLPSANWSNVENGIEQRFIEQFFGLNKRVDKPVNICLVARLVSHHQIDVLVESIRFLTDEERKGIHLHLIGSGFDYLKKELSELAVISNHGFVDHVDLAEILKKMHVGIITGGPEYASHMKLFDYAAAKVAVVAPETYHLKKWYEGKGVIFFKSGDANSMTSVFRGIIRKPEMLETSAELLYHHVSEHHTWEQVFAVEAKIILENLQVDR